MLLKPYLIYIYIYIYRHTDIDTVFWKLGDHPKLKVEPPLYNLTTYIHNEKTFDEYILILSTYVTIMSMLGLYIKEWLTKPKLTMDQPKINMLALQVYGPIIGLNHNISNTPSN